MESELHREAWQHFMAAEHKELVDHQNGLIGKLLGHPLPEESHQEIEWLAEEDRRTAHEGMVALMSGRGEVAYKHIDDLSPQDRAARIRFEGKRIEWIAGRMRKKYLATHSRAPDSPGPPAG